MFQLQEKLCEAAEARIQDDFEWERYESLGSTALFAPDAADYLEPRELGWMVDNFGDVDQLNGLETQKLDYGKFGSVYQIANTDIAVKKFYPFIYYGGYKGDNTLRKVTNSSILRDLRISLILEGALKEEKDYTTPKYIGHLMLEGAKGDIRHYTLMSKLDTVDTADITDTESARNSELITQCRDRCEAALGVSRHRGALINFDITDHRKNIPPVRNEETGELQLAVIDQETFFKWRRKVGAPPVSYRDKDPNAPWLATDRDLSPLLSQKS